MKVLNKKKTSVLAGQKPLKKGSQGRKSWLRTLSMLMLSAASLWVFAVFLKGFAAPQIEQWLPSIYQPSKIEFVLEAKNLSEKRKTEIEELLEKTITVGSRYEMDQAKNALVSLLAVEKVSLARTKKNRIDVKIIARIPFVKISEIDHAWATKEGVVFINHDVEQFDIEDLPVLSGAVQPRAGEEVKKESEITVSSTEMHAVTQAINLLNLLSTSELMGTGAAAERTTKERINVENKTKNDSSENLNVIMDNKDNQNIKFDETKVGSKEKPSPETSLVSAHRPDFQPPKIIEVHWNAYRGISFTTSDSTEIVIGQGPFEDKLKTLYKLFADGKSRDYSHIELDYRGKIFAKKRG